MNKDKVEQLVKAYHENKARVEFLEVEIPELHKILEQLELTLVDDEVTISQNLSGMPRGTKVSDPTGKLGAMLADKIDSPRMREFKEEIRDKERELSEKRVQVLFVQAWMKALSPRERFVFEAKYCNVQYWRDIAYGFEKQFGEQYSKDSLKRIAQSAMRKIYTVAS